VKEISLEDGIALVRFARQNIEFFLENEQKLAISADLAKKFYEKAGAFVTLNRFTTKSENPLRGCIGHIAPENSLIETVQNVSIAAAVDDPRFSPIKREEMEKIVVEVSVLTVPEIIEVSDPEQYLKQIIIGRDGLIVTQGFHRGLLLPNVPIEHDRNWNVREFLEHTCTKAWLSEDAWKDIKHTKIEKFKTILFEEESPGGPIRRKSPGNLKCER
jgi:uncharacterized protein (TIGR00296 family)